MYQLKMYSKTLHLAILWLYVIQYNIFRANWYTVFQWINNQVFISICFLEDRPFCGIENNIVKAFLQEEDALR